MTKKSIHPRERLQKVSNILRKAAMSGDRNLPRDLLSVAFSNVGKVRRDVLDVVFQEIGRYVENFADNYTIKVRAEFNFERKKPKKKQADSHKTLVRD